MLSNAVGKLRAALGEEYAGRIVTVPRVGYRFTGPIQRLQARTAEHLFQAGEPVPGREAFSLTRPLGLGSNSDVWLARHAKLGQEHVFKFADDGARLSALKREYTLYRVLKQELGPRDDFARVIDTNFLTAPFFLECEYGGHSLLEWAEEGGRLASITRAARLELFLQIARAVTAAHSVGVLHKDLKPGNILIDGGPDHWQTRLTDFGSGRLLDPTRLEGLQLTALGLTQTQDATPNSRSGTLMYLAPEVLVGQSPSTQSDLYALGLILYQMLVGDLRRPMATGWQRDVDDELLREDITASTEQLEARLPSVGELLDRLTRLEARRAEVKTRAMQAAQAAQAAAQLVRTRLRRPWVTGAFIVLVLGLSASLWWQARAAAAARQAEAASVRAQAINDFLTKDLLYSRELATSGGHEPVTMLEILRRGSLAASARFKSQPLAEAAARHHLAQTFQRLSSASDAESEYRRAVALLEGVVRPDDPWLLKVQFERVLLHFEMNKPGEGIKLFEETRNLAGAKLVSAHPELAALAARARVAVHIRRAEFAEALAAGQVLVTLVDSAPNGDTADRIEARRVLADAYMAAGEVDAGNRVLAELSTPPFSLHPAAAIAQSRVSMLSATRAREARQFDKAEKILLDALDKLTGSPEPSQWHIGYVHSELGHVYKSADRYDEAAASYSLALPFFRHALGKDHQFVRITAINLANTEVDRGRYTQALTICVEHEPWFKVHAAKGRYRALEFAMGRALLGAGRPTEALPHLEYFPKPGPDDLPTGNADSGDADSAWEVQAYRGAALVGTGRRAEGLALIREARAVFAKAGRLPTRRPSLDHVFASHP